jgi:uncharacterized protein YdhG (YjbR/CyaY superfamily)
MEEILMSFALVEDYINSLDEKGMECVYEFHAFMKNEFPEISPKICFAMPMWWAGVKMYGGYL